MTAYFAFLTKTKNTLFKKSPFFSVGHNHHRLFVTYLSPENQKGPHLVIDLHSLIVGMTKHEGHILLLMRHGKKGFHSNAQSKLRQKIDPNEDILACGMNGIDSIEKKIAYISHSEIMDFDYVNKSFEMLSKWKMSDYSSHDERHTQELPGEKGLTQLSLRPGFHANHFGVFCNGRPNGYYDDRTYVIHRNHNLILKTCNNEHIYPHPTKPLYLSIRDYGSYRMTIFLGRERTPVERKMYATVDEEKKDGDYNEGCAVKIARKSPLSPCQKKYFPIQ
jgi:hypothetical protein